LAVNIRTSHPKIRPEWELTLRCSRPKLGIADAERVSELLHEGVNWQELTACVLQHGVASLVFKNLSVLGEDLVPSVWREALRQEAAEIDQWHASGFTEACNVSQAFAAAEIPILPYQVPVLAWLASRHSRERPLVDLELMIQQENMPRAAAILAGLEYQPGFAPTSGHNIADQSVHAWFPFHRQSRTIVVYAERALQYFPEEAELRELARNLKSFEFGNCKILSPSLEHALFTICVNGTINFWDRLSYICDVSNLIQSNPVNWAHAKRTAGQFRSTRMLLLGAYLAHQVLDAGIPSEVLSQSKKDVSVQQLAISVQERLNGSDRSGRSAFDRAAFRIRTRDSFLTGVSHTLHLAITPIKEERETETLSSKKYLFHQIAHRPWRLLREYGVGLRERERTDLSGFSATRQEIIDRALQLVDVKPEDVLYDLGCGDGQVVISAAKQFGIRAIGIDINPVRISEARDNARRASVQHSVEFLVQDAKKFDVSEATIVWLFLDRFGTLRLLENLRSRLRPGARILSHTLPIIGWPPHKQELVTLSNGAQRMIFLWRI
jgi:precorrin-6B methylase 2